ncbi:hypothetical protein BJX66DRAFT_306585 [Aspergillus keveii]|uniref:Uncharacterized protein n=1 Tax=Aspergillus keveii TaxID=714993 RepID=A0ABR4G2I0_9EURO
MWILTNTYHYQGGILARGGMKMALICYRSLGHMAACGIGPLLLIIAIVGMMSLAR